MNTHMLESKVIGDEPWHLGTSVSRSILAAQLRGIQGKSSSSSMSSSSTIRSAPSKPLPVHLPKQIYLVNLKLNLKRSWRWLRLLSEHGTASPPFWNSPSMWVLYILYIGRQLSVKRHGYTKELFHCYERFLFRKASGMEPYRLVSLKWR